jgi:hypothetical protein
MRLLKTVNIILFLLISSFCLISCTNENIDQDKELDQSVFDENSIQLQDNNLRIRLSTNKRIYEPHEQVFVSANLKNLSSAPITIHLNSGVFPFTGNNLLVQVDLKYSNVYRLYEEDVDLDYGYSRHITLSKGDDYSYNVVWDQQILLNPGSIQIPSGEYTIYAKLFHNSRWDESEVVGSLQVEIEVTGSPTKLVAQEDAVDIAVQSPEGQQWLRAHSLANVRTDAYIKQGMWLVRLSAPKGPQPHIFGMDVNVVEIGEEGNVTPDKAIEIALELAEVKKWYKDHSGPNIVKQENGEIFVWFRDGWQKVIPSFTYNGLTIDEINKYQPRFYVTIEEGVWQLHGRCNLGPAPHDITIHIDSKTGEVYGVSTP